MPFLELTLPCRESEQPRYERALDDVGALAVTLLDAGADTDNEHAILEPGVGETPLWPALSLTALFAHDTDGLALLAALEAFDPCLDWSQASFRNVEDQDWERAWMDRYEPLRFGARTWIVPWNRELPEEAQQSLRDEADTLAAGATEVATSIAPTRETSATVRLDPGLAFGSGTHPTTALCLRWLDALAGDGALRGKTVLDFGCGSGILALAALKLGAAGAVGIDNDPQALLATRDNAERNGVAEALSVYLPDDAPETSYPVVVANILASALDALADTLAARVAPGGRIALSGVLDGQQASLLLRYAAWFDDLRVEVDGDWVRIDGLRRMDA
ncbi:MAG: 50S ribosomal protein L11 methyltransferase [Luteimonas sp.]